MSVSHDCVQVFISVRICISSSASQSRDSSKIYLQSGEDLIRHGRGAPVSCIFKGRRRVHGVSWVVSMSSWSVLVAASVGSVRCRRRTVVGEATVKRGCVRVVGGETIASKYREVWCEPSVRTAIAVAHMCEPSAGGRSMAVAKHSSARVCCMFPVWSYLMYGHDDQGVT